MRPADPLDARRCAVCESETVPVPRDHAMSASKVSIALSLLFLLVFIAGTLYAAWATRKA